MLIRGEQDGAVQTTSLLDAHIAFCKSSLYAPAFCAVPRQQVPNVPKLNVFSCEHSHTTKYVCKKPALPTNMSNTPNMFQKQTPLHPHQASVEAILKSYTKSHVTAHTMCHAGQPPAGHAPQTDNSVTLCNCNRVASAAVTQGMFSG